MRVSHSFPAISETFDDPNLVSCAGLAPTMALAQRAGLADLVSSTLTLKAVGGVNAHLKVPALVAGMVAGADSIDDMDLLRHGGMGRLFTGIRAPSTSTTPSKPPTGRAPGRAAAPAVAGPGSQSLSG